MKSIFLKPSPIYLRLGIFSIFCIVLISGLYSANRIQAVAVTTDFAFGVNGVVQTSIATETAVQDAAIQPDGKIVVVGYGRFTSEPPYFTVTRYNSDGSLDESFDGNGIVIGHFRIAGTYYASYGRAVTIQPDGKIIVAGDSTVTENNVSTTEFGAARLNTDGSFDNSFDGDGRVSFSAAPTQRDNAYQVAVQPNGKIVLSGNAGNGVNEFYPAVARLNPNGSLDTTFFGDGTVDYVGDIYGYASALHITPDGKINVVTDVVSPASANALTVFLRYNADGSPDTTFGSGGRRATGAIGRVNAVGIQPDGKIILGSQYFSMIRLNADYSLDTSFGNNGGATASFGQYSAWMNDLAVQADGKIVAAGYTNTEAGVNVGCDFAVARFNADGSLDTTFDSDGKIVASVGSRIERADSVLSLPNGKILVIGKAGQTSELGQATLLRFMGDLNPADFDGDTKTDIAVFRPTNGNWFLSQTANGFKGIAWGLTSDKLVPGDYTGDGRTDVAIYRPSTGDWFILRSENSAYYSVRFGAPTDLPVQADYDGDGKTDIAVFRPSNGTWYRLGSLDNGISAVQFGAAEDKPVSGDFDGDGRADISLFRPSNGTFYRINSFSGQFSAAQFGDGGDIPVSADFNGDSKTDTAVFRPSNGVWYWKRSGDGAVQAVQWGQTGDVPTQADYDGDGKTDVAVFRPSNGIWYLNNSTAGFAGIQFGQNGDQPIPNFSIP